MKNIFSILLIFISLSIAAQQHYRVTRLDFNTDGSEMAPVIYKNGIVFSSNKKSSVLVVATDQNDNYPYNLYFAEKKGPKWARPSLFSPGITSKLNESSATFSTDFSTMYITRSHLASLNMSQIQKADTIHNGIFECSLAGKDWRIEESFFFNDKNYDIAFPSLSADGNTLYFASKAAGGKGGYDLYVSEKRGVTWSDPVNLGSTINTDENEVFPFIHENGRLYFSSRGHNSQGNLDIFYTEKRGGEWITPINLPKPFNSRQDDFGYVLSTRMDTGYFASNRRGSDDIYLFASTFPAFDVCPYQVDESFCYSFVETGSMDLDTTSLKYEWDLGDGTKVRSMSVEHCYSEIGYYLVSLNVIDTLTGEIYFSEASYDLNVQPMEQPYISVADTVRVSEKVSFNAKQSVIKNFEPKDYYWDFGDGNIETDIETEHIYTSSGEYYIRLGITNGVTEEDADKENISLRACSHKRIIVLE